MTSHIQRYAAISSRRHNLNIPFNIWQSWMPPKGRRGRGRWVATLKTVEPDVEEQSKGPAALYAEDSDGSSASSSIKRAKKTKGVVTEQYACQDEDQHVMSEFWVSNTIFYDKSQRNYKNKELKKQKNTYFIEDNKDLFYQNHKTLPTGEYRPFQVHRVKTRGWYIHIYYWYFSVKRFRNLFVVDLIENLFSILSVWYYNNITMKFQLIYIITYIWLNKTHISDENPTQWRKNHL